MATMLCAMVPGNVGKTSVVTNSTVRSSSAVTFSGLTWSQPGAYDHSLRTVSNDQTTCSAVSVSPLWNLTPSRMVNSQDFSPVDSQLLASHGCSSMSSVTQIRGSSVFV